MSDTEPEREESWTEDGVHFLLDQPQALRSKRVNNWLFGLIGLAIGSVPIALAFLFLPFLAPGLLWITAIVLPVVFGWAILPPFAIARMNRPQKVSIENGQLQLGDQTFERGSIRSVSWVDGHIEVARRDGSVYRGPPAEPVDAERLMRLLDSVEVSDDQAEAEKVAKREALRRLRPLREQAQRS